MESCVAKHASFLKDVVRDPRVIVGASAAEIGCLVEILFNVHKIALNRTERNSIVKFLPIIRYIGKCRSAEKARGLLETFARHFLRTIVRVVIAKQKERKK